MLPSSPVAQVIERMETILRPLAQTDGLACFTRLYLAVTQGVETGLVGATFADPDFLGRLDAHFADLFFAAVDASQPDRGSVPRAWLPLLEARSRKGIAPLQFALAGMNAHINRDLPVALVTTCEESGVNLEQSSPQHADYLRINQVLATVEAHVKEQYLSGWLRTLDRLVHRVDRIDDIAASWDIARARDAAWTNAEALWAIRSDRDLYGRYLDTLDRSVGLAGRGLLVPADTWLGKLGRTLGLG